LSRRAEASSDCLSRLIPSQSPIHRLVFVLRLLTRWAALVGKIVLVVSQEIPSTPQIFGRQLPRAEDPIQNFVFEVANGPPKIPFLLDLVLRDEGFGQLRSSLGRQENVSLSELWDAEPSG
jgi:hypothetical protein